MSAVHMLILLEDSTSSPDTQHSQEARWKKYIFLPCVSSTVLSTPKTWLCLELVPRHHPVKNWNTPICSWLSSLLSECRQRTKGEGSCLKVPQPLMCLSPTGKPQCLWKPPLLGAYIAFALNLSCLTHCPHCLQSKIHAACTVAAKPCWRCYQERELFATGECTCASQLSGCTNMWSVADSSPREAWKVDSATT